MAKGLLPLVLCHSEKSILLLNEVLRRGGKYKNGAIVLHYDLDGADIIEFITASRAELPWVKRCVNITEDSWKAASEETKEALLFGIKSGDIWLNKIKYDNEGNRIRGNVCLEVYLPSRGTCLLQHVNLSACEYDDIPRAFAEGMQQLCSSMLELGLAIQENICQPRLTDRSDLECLDWLTSYGGTK